MELTSSLETERHMAKELASKLSNMGVEREESKRIVSIFNLDSLREKDLFERARSKVYDKNARLPGYLIFPS